MKPLTHSNTLQHTATVSAVYITCCCLNQDETIFIVADSNAGVVVWDIGFVGMPTAAMGMKPVTRCANWTFEGCLSINHLVYLEEQVSCLIATGRVV